jgi:PPP family 3-phenylpropionic acid transporter
MVMGEDGVLRVRASGVVAMLVTVGAHLALLGALAPVLPLHVLALGGTPALWGLLGGCTGFLMMFSEPAWGWLGDRLGIRRPYFLARAALALSLWLLVLWPGLLVVVLWQVVTGLFESTIGVLARGYVVRAYRPSRQAFGLSLYLVVYSGFLAFGSTAGGWLFQRAGTQAVFVFTALMGTVAAVASLFLVEPPPFPASEVQPSRGPVSLASAVNGPALILGVAALLQFVDNRVVRNFLVLLAQERAGLDASAAGLLFGAFSIANIFFLTLLNRFDRRISLATRVALGLAVGAAGMVVYSVARSFAGLLVAVTLDALGWALASPARIMLVGRLSPPSLYGWALGLHGAFENVGVLAGPLIAGALWTVAGPAAPYRVSALLMAVGAVVALRLRGIDVVRRAAPAT